MKGPAPRYVVDSSVVFKWFSTEGEQSVAEALELLAAHGRAEIRLSAPALMPFEVLNALRCAGLDAGQLRRAAESLTELEVELVVPDGELLVESGRIALQEGLTVYDASFVALAKLCDCELVSADRKAFQNVEACRVRLL